MLADLPKGFKLVGALRDKSDSFVERGLVALA